MFSRAVVVMSLAGHSRTSLTPPRLDWRQGSLARIVSRPPRLEHDGEPTGIATDSRTTPVALLSQGYLYLGGQCEGIFDI